MRPTLRLLCCAAFACGCPSSVRQPVELSGMPSAKIEYLGSGVANDETISFRVTFSEDVTGVDVTDFAVTSDGAIVDAFVLSVEEISPSEYIVTVNSGSGDGTLGLILLDDGSIKSIATGEGLFVPEESAPLDTALLTIDRTPPRLVAIAAEDPASGPRNEATLGFIASFSEAVEPVATDDFALAMTDGATGTVALVTPLSETELAITVADVAGNGTLRLDLADLDASIHDAAGNALETAAITGASSFTVDRIAPALTTLDLKSGSPNPTTSNAATFTLSFSEAVSPLAASDFVVATTGTASASVGDITALSPSIFEVSLGALAGEGTLRLDLGDADASIRDSAGNGLATGVVPGTTALTIDLVAPSLVSIARAGGASSATNGTTTSFTVTFSEAVSPVSAADFSLSFGGGLSGALGSVSMSSPMVYSVSVVSLAGEGTVRVDLADADLSIHDTLGNALAVPSVAGDETVTVDHTPPPAPSALVLSDPLVAKSNDGTPTFMASGLEPGATLELFTDAACTLLVGSAIATASDDDASATLTPGTHAIYARQVDPAGNPSGCSTAFVLYQYIGETEIAAGNGAADDALGATVAINGGVIAVGAPGKGGDTGAVYLYRFDPSMNAWSESEVSASGGAPGDRFGSALAVSGGSLAVGAPGGETLYVFLFDPSSGAWSQISTLSATDGVAGDAFGAAIAMNGGLIAVGAPNADVSSDTDRGAAYVFRFDPSANSWGSEVKLIAANGAPGSHFGRNIAASSDTIVIGAPDHGGTGAAYVFQYDPDTDSGTPGAQPEWTTGASLPIVDGETLLAGDDYGASVAISANAIVVGAPGDDAGGNERGCAYVYLFDPSDNSWFGTKLTAGAAQDGDRFGQSVAISGNTIVAGSAAGSTHLFYYDPSSHDWLETPIAPAQAAANDLYGASVSIRGGTFVVGAPGKNSSAGAFFVYAAPILSGEVKLMALAPGDDDNFGSGVAAGEDMVVVGSPRNDGPTGQQGQGAVYIYRFDPSNNTWPETKLRASDGNAADLLGDDVALSGNTIVAGASSADPANRGAAYVYRYDPSSYNWVQKKLVTADADVYYAGTGVGVIDNTVVSGAWGAMVGAAAQQGAIYVYQRRPDDSWVETRLVASDGLEYEHFGESVSVSGHTIVVGVPDRLSYSGGAYVYRYDPSSYTWDERLLLASDYNQEFGLSVSVEGDTLVVGSAFGAYVYRFDSVSNDWQETKLVATDASSFTAFGRSVALSGDVVAVGASETPNGDNLGQGAGYLFRFDPNSQAIPPWIEQKVIASDGAYADRLGIAAGLFGRTAIFGTEGDDQLVMPYYYNHGSAYLFPAP